MPHFNGLMEFAEELWNCKHQPGPWHLRSFFTEQEGLKDRQPCEKIYKLFSNGYRPPLITTADILLMLSMRSRSNNTQVIFTYWPLRVTAVLNKETYNWSSKLWPLQHPYSRVIRIWALGNQCTFMIATMSLSHRNAICVLHSWQGERSCSHMTLCLMTCDDFLNNCSWNQQTLLSQEVIWLFT